MQPEFQDSGTSALIAAAETKIQNNDTIKGVGLMINVARKRSRLQWAKLLAVVKKGLSVDEQKVLQKLCSCDGPGVFWPISCHRPVFGSEAPTMLEQISWRDISIPSKIRL